MATSIDKSVNWRNAAATPDYQVTAQRVDTFVQGERNTKGMQVAAALESAAGTLSSVAKSQARKLVLLKKRQWRKKKPEIKCGQTIWQPVGKNK